MSRLITSAILLITAFTLASCSTPPSVKSSRTVKVVQPPFQKAPVKPTKAPVLTELVGSYSLFEDSESNFEIRQQAGKLAVHKGGNVSPLQQVSPTVFQLAGGRRIEFAYSNEGKYDRFKSTVGGQTHLFIKDDSLKRGREGVTNQAVYTWQLINDLNPNGYTRSRFISPSRGTVDYTVYLPQGWSRESKETYPLVIFLHGQTGWERSFPESVPASQLQQWMARGLIPKTVIVSLRTGRIGASGREEEQWTTPRNETLMTSESANELRAFIRQQFRAGMSAKTTSIHGHSRGSRAAIHYALKFPDSFASSVANAFVSDYALPETMKIAKQNQSRLSTRGIPLRISIGDRDEFALNLGRKASPVIHKYLQDLQIPHQYQVFKGVDHGFVSLWNAPLANGMPNGLGELQFHAGAWR
ncbi:alpha/beta hydrolase [Leucothrix arctica]|uniref:Esterase n=1 Tax=Leucothrix arctica TaxID=1481894 RepID=A0A317CDI6_9GAMM|nr:alpha/beta hydrolase-fold protein [Leucothrix arctica]PWQ96171.1 hypothetical protein DKT75_09240 [Leucothrix arctica]